MDIFGGSSQNWTIFRVISMHLGSSLSVKVQNAIAKILNIFGGP